MVTVPVEHILGIGDETIRRFEEERRQGTLFTRREFSLAGSP
jgi:hypothetical protein